MELSDVPQTLYVRGNPRRFRCRDLHHRARKASPYGLAVAELAAKVAVEAGVTVVSGGAVGCDQTSGWAAVNAGGKHVVVLGTRRRCCLSALERRPAYAHARYGWRGRFDLPVGHGSSQVCLSAAQSRDRRLSQPSLYPRRVCLPGRFYSEAAMDLGENFLPYRGRSYRPSRVARTISLLNGACCIIDEESIEMAISRIYGPCATRARCSRHCRLDPTQQTVMHALIASPLKVDDIAALVSLDAVGVLKLLGHLNSRALSSA
ncbi:MAG: DNA-processing protein DprA [Collinsella sp.]